MVNSAVNYRLQWSWGKVILSQVCVKNSVHSWGEHAWQGGMHSRGACMVGGMQDCMAWVEGGMCGRGTCLAGGVHGRGSLCGRACMAGGVCMAGGLLGVEAWMVGCVYGRGYAWEDKWQFQWAVHILLEAFLLLSMFCSENLFLAAYVIQP